MFHPPTPQSAYTTPRAGLSLAGITRVWRCVRSALLTAAAALWPCTAQAQTCNTVAGGIVYADACCFKVQPQSYQKSCEGSSGIVTLQAEFLGAEPHGFLESNTVTWQWEKQSASGSWQDYGAPGENVEASLSIPLGQPAYAGTYRCRFYEGYNTDHPSIVPCGTTYSATSTIVVEAVPSPIYVQQVSQTICPNTNFSLNVSGPVPDSNNTYQWYKNGVAITDGNYYGATSNELYINNVTEANEAAYHCVLTHSPSCALVRTSNTVNITVEPPGPTLTSRPSDRAKSTCPGTPVSLGPVVATGVDFTYQWYKVLTPTTNLRLSDGFPLGNQTQFSGTNTGTLTISNAALSATGTYFCTIAGVCNTIDPAYTCDVTITPSLEFDESFGIDPVVSPVGTFCEAYPPPTGVFIRAQATPYPPGSTVYYKWYKKTGANFVPIIDGNQPGNASYITGAGTNQIRLVNIRTAASGDYRCKASTDPGFNPACGTVDGRIQTLTVVNTTSSIVSYPTDLQLCPGSDAVFAVTATGSPRYLWSGPTSTGGYVQLHDGVQAGTGTVVSGATTNTLRLTGIHAADFGGYKCEVVNSCGFGGGGLATAHLTTFDAPTITTQPPATMSGCIGSTAFVSVAATGSELTYQWMRNGVDLNQTSTYSNVNTPTLLVAIGANFTTANFSCRITGTCTSIVSNATSLSRSTPVVISTQPVAVSGCAGINANFSVAISAGTNPTYQWRRNGIALVDGTGISGATSTALALTNVSSASAGYYRCDITNACGVISSDSVLLNVESPVVITPPVGQSACNGGTISFSVEAAGSNLTFDWRNGSQTVITPGVKANGTVVSISSTATTSTLTMTNTQDADIANFYHARITNSCGFINSPAAAVTFNPSATITTHPQPQTVCAGSPASLSVAASGGAVTFQWQKDGVNIANGGIYSGVTTSVLSISNGQTGDSGMYRCRVTNLCGTGTLDSNAALVTINPLVVITTQPVAQPVCLNSTAVFSVAATGGPFTYQWQKDTVNIAGATSATLTLPGITAASVGSYRCKVTNNCNFVFSSAAALTINTPAITNQPDAFAGCTGSNATFAITVSGSNPTYQWKKGSTILSDGGRISGATTRILTISALVAGDAATNYNCVVTTPCGSVTSSNAALTVSNTPPVITTQPVSQDTCSGSSAFLRVIASGSNLKYQWQKNGVNMSGETNSTLVLGNSGAYRCIVSNGCGSVTSDSATVTAYDPTSILSQPLSPTVCAGTGITLSVATNLAQRWQWQKLTAPNVWTNMVDGGNVSGSSSPNLQFSPLSAGDAGSYRCIASNGCNSVTSTTSVLTVNTPVVITASPFAHAACESGNTTFSVGATGSGLAYRWQRNNSNLTDGGQYSGVLTPTLTITGVSAADAGNFRCRLTGTCSSAMLTPNAALTITTTPPVITSQPVAVAACEGEDAIFSVVSTGFESFRWKKNGANLVDAAGILGAATDTLTLAAIDAADIAAYSCDITNGCGTTTSDAAALTLTGASPQITAQPQSAGSCDPASAQFVLEATSDDPIAYRWQWLPAFSPAWSDLVEGDNTDFGTPLLNAAGVDTATLTVTPLDGSASNASLRCIVSNLCGSVTSDPADFSTAVCCPADFNQDGGIDGADVDSFFAAWEIGDPTADVNLDGGVDGSDVDYFFFVWEAGGCN